jgi:hypothetical protein
MIPEQFRRGYGPEGLEEALACPSGCPDTGTMTA